MKTTTRSLAVEDLDVEDAEAETAVEVVERNDDDAMEEHAGDDASFDLDAMREEKPTWFDATTFEREDFDPWAYVEEVTSFVDEETLRETLERFEEEVRGELETIVNENYEQFASLGDDLEDYEALRERIGPGVRESREATIEERIGSFERWRVWRRARKTRAQSRASE